MITRPWCRHRIFILLTATSTVRLTSAVCLDGTCASSTRSSVSGTRSLLQQSTQRAAAAEDRDPVGIKPSNPAKPAAVAPGGVAASPVSPHLHQVSARPKRQPSEAESVIAENTAQEAEAQQVAEEAEVQHVDEAKACWSKRIDGMYVLEGHGDESECYDFQTAKANCVAAADCYAITTQSNICIGSYRVTHGTPTLHSYADWEGISLGTYTLDRECLPVDTSAPVPEGDGADDLEQVTADDAEEVVADDQEQVTADAQEKVADGIRPEEVNAHDPQPGANPHLPTALIDQGHRLIMGWSPRAACTAAITMFFQSAGLYTAQEEASFPWVHDYREALGDIVKPQQSDMRDPEFLKFKVVRNPFRRAVSSWVHQQGTNFSNDPHIQGLAQENGLTSDCSFVEWLRFVNKVGSDEMDEHAKPQFSGWERAGGRYEVIVQLEADNFDDQLDEINAKAGSHLKFQTMHVSLMAASQEPQEGSPGDDQFFDATMKWKHPPAEDMFTLPPDGAEAAELVMQIYAEDFEAYSYSTDINLM